MKKSFITIALTLAFALAANAQYLGGNGDGSASKFTKLTYMNPTATAIPIIVHDTLFVNINADSAKTFTIDWGNTETSSYSFAIGNSTVYHVYNGTEILINTLLVNGKMLSLYANVNSSSLITPNHQTAIVGWTAWVRH